MESDRHGKPNRWLGNRGVVQRRYWKLRYYSVPDYQRGQDMAANFLTASEISLSKSAPAASPPDRISPSRVFLIRCCDDLNGLSSAQRGISHAVFYIGWRKEMDSNTLGIRENDNVKRNYTAGLDGSTTVSGTILNAFIN